MDDVFGTISDLGLAAALITRGFRLVEIRRDKSNRAWFFFEDHPQMDMYEEAYWDGGFSVEAREFFDNIKMLKGRIYAGKKP